MDVYDCLLIITELSSDPAVIPPPLPSTSATKCTHTFPSPSMPVSSHALISSLPQADDLVSAFLLSLPLKEALHCVFA